MRSIEERLKRHKAFWTNQSVDRHLMEFVIGGWSAYRTNPAHIALCNKPAVQAADIEPSAFIPWVEQYLNDSAGLDDDAIRPAQPHQAIPWLEAAIGCNIRSGDDHIWSEPFLQEPVISRLPESIAESPWTKKYIEFLNVYGDHFGSEIPLAQSILRGPLDLASAVLGEEQCMYALADTPEAMERFLQRITTLSVEFFRLQWEHIPSFHGGMVVGQYDLWVPGQTLRFQEDATALLSPNMYKQFVLPCDETICALTPWNVYHLHSTSLHLLPQILEIPNLGAI